MCGATGVRHSRIREDFVSVNRAKQARRISTMMSREEFKRWFSELAEVLGVSEVKFRKSPLTPPKEGGTND